MFWTVILTIFHVMVSLVLIAVVLLQTGKRADIAGAFGGGGSQTAFGARGAATVLSRVTTICAILFMVTSLVLAIMSSRREGMGGGSVLEKVAPQTEAPAPTPAPAPAPPTPPAK